VFHWGIGVQISFVDGIAHLSYSWSGLADLCVHLDSLHTASFLHLRKIETSLVYRSDSQLCVLL
jgi:hypothetical protein